MFYLQKLCIIKLENMLTQSQNIQPPAVVHRMLYFKAQSKMVEGCKQLIQIILFMTQLVKTIHLVCD